ncbi:hypothetical protein IMY05_003G0167300 [Salix suchowensis]|nr:hypothetical protein IMY05_003G0167300 [Salix suchowensis]
MKYQARLGFAEAATVSSPHSWCAKQTLVSPLATENECTNHTSQNMCGVENGIKAEKDKLGKIREV